MEGLIVFDSLLVKTMICVIINPLFWNTIGQIEYYHHTFSQLFCKKTKFAVIILGIIIILLNVLRTSLFEAVIQTQPKFHDLPGVFELVGITLFAIGQIFVISSFWRLGFYTTFMGDYFGIFEHDAPITSFPFNVCNDPMYWGSTIIHFGTAFYQRSCAGCILTVWLAIVYRLAITQESKMLGIIYSKKSN